MVLVNHFNPKGEIVGYNDKDTYYTIRDAAKNQIYIVKKVFNGKRFDKPVAIQRAIVRRLIASGVKWVIVIIKEEGKMYYTKTLLTDIIEQGVLNCWDKNQKNVWGWQYVWDISKKRVDKHQNRLV